MSDPKPAVTLLSFRVPADVRSPECSRCYAMPFDGVPTHPDGSAGLCTSCSEPSKNPDCQIACECHEHGGACNINGGCDCPRWRWQQRYLNEIRPRSIANGEFDESLGGRGQ